MKDMEDKVAGDKDAQASNSVHPCRVCVGASPTIGDGAAMPRHEPLGTCRGHSFSCCGSV